MKISRIMYRLVHNFPRYAKQETPVLYIHVSPKLQFPHLIVASTSFFVQIIFENISWGDMRWKWGVKSVQFIFLPIADDFAIVIND